MWSATKTISASGFGFLQYSSMAASFSSFEPRPKRLFTPRTKKHLKWRHQRGRAGAVENFGKIVFREVELEQAEVTQISRNQVLEDGVPKTLAEESFIANETHRPDAACAIRVR